MFVAVAHTVSSQYPQLHCYSFPAPITPPPHCGVGAAAPEAGAGWAVKLLVRVYCVSHHRSHTHHHHPSLLTISHHHITTCHTGPHDAGAGLGPGGGVPVLTSERLHAVLVSPSSSQPRQRPCSPASPAQPGTLGRILLAECSRTQPTQLAQLAS